MVWEAGIWEKLSIVKSRKLDEENHSLKPQWAMRKHHPAVTRVNKDCVYVCLSDLVWVWGKEVAWLSTWHVHMSHEYAHVFILCPWHMYGMCVCVYECVEAASNHSAIWHALDQPQNEILGNQSCPEPKQAQTPGRLSPRRALCVGLDVVLRPIWLVWSGGVRSVGLSWGTKAGLPQLPVTLRPCATRSDTAQPHLQPLAHPTCTKGTSLSTHKRACRSQPRLGGEKATHRPVCQTLCTIF